MAMPEENLKLIETQNDTMWFAGAPLLVCAVRLALDVATGDIFTSAKFQNLYPQNLKSMVFDVICYDQFREPIRRLTDLRFSDLNEERNAEFGYERRIEIPDLETRNVEYILKRTDYDDGSFWENTDDKRYDTKIEQQSLYSVQGDCNKQFLDICARSGINGLNLVLQPEFGEDHWLCACGTFNWNSDEKCSRCKVNRAWLQKSTDLELLRQKRDAQADQSQKIQEEVASLQQTKSEKQIQNAEFEERKAHLLTEQRREKTRRIRRRLRITGAVLVALAIAAYLLMTFVFPRFLEREKKQNNSQSSISSAASVSVPSDNAEPPIKSYTI